MQTRGRPDPAGDVPADVSSDVPGEERVRRSVVPTVARRTPWFAAAWTGIGVVVVCAVIAIVAVAVCWLPAAGSGAGSGSGAVAGGASAGGSHTNSTIRAGLLTFLAALHGGLTVDGVATSWLPLGMALVVVLVAWRAGSGLADAATEQGETDPVRLVLAGLAQALAFAAGCVALVPFATLGTSRVPFLGVALAAVVLFALSGSVAFVRSSALRTWAADRVPRWLGPVLRGGAGAAAVYLTAGALLTAASLVAHRDTAEVLSQQVGGGIGSVPVLLLGVLAAPNAAAYGAAYLAGPGFAVGTGTSVSLFGAAHGTLPAFPPLAAIPGGPAGPAVWTCVGLTALLAGAAAARAAMQRPGWGTRVVVAGAAALAAGAVLVLVGWQAGGAVGDGRLQTVGPSPVQFGAAATAAVALCALLCLGLAAVGQAVRTWVSRRGAARRDAASAEDSETDGFLDALRRPARLVLHRTTTAGEDSAEEPDDDRADRAS